MLNEEDEEDLAYLRSLEELEGELRSVARPKVAHSSLAGPKVAHSSLARPKIVHSSLTRLKVVHSSLAGPKIAHSFTRPSFSNDPPSQGVLGRCELLAVEQFGQGAAVSLEQKRVGVVATVWNAAGEAVMICAPRSTRTEAIRLLREALRSAK